MPGAQDKSQKPITYADAGVDIDAGNALVTAIKPLAKATSRPGADVELGGFGGLFDLKRAGFRDPILVAANDGVGTKLKIAIDTGRHGTIGIDLVAMCVNDLVVQGRRTAVLSRLSRRRQTRRRRGARRDRRHCGGMPASRLCADRRGNGRDAWHVQSWRLRSRWISQSAPSSATKFCRVPTSQSATS